MTCLAQLQYPRITHLDGWFEHQYPMVPLIRYVNLAVTIYCQTLRRTEIAVSASLAAPLTKEPAMWVKYLDSMIVSV